MAALIGLLAGAVLGHAVWGEWGAILGGLAGFFAGATMTGTRQRAAFRKPDAAGAAAPLLPTSTHDRALIDRVNQLEQRVAGLERALGQATGAPTTAPVTDAATIGVPTTAIEAVTAESTQVPQPPAATGGAQALAPAAAAASPFQPDGTLAARVPDAMAATSPMLADRATSAPAVAPPNPLWAWFTGGNALTRIGVVILFFGVAFLLRYFAEHFTLPLELRLAGVAVVGVALVALGMRLAGTRPGYGLSLQGAGAGVLYLTTFAAFRLYAVLPDEAGIGLLIAIAALTVWLALRADSQALAGLAFGGGFLAPMLTATGGAPLPLFGYFAVLNGAVFALAWRRAWRALNVLGFVFTFVLGAVWGHRFYTSAHFATVEPFLMLFFVYYVAIAVLEARRGALEVQRPVDGILVFGVPLAGFALQVALVRDFRYGAAWSALALAIVYAGLFLALRKRPQGGLALMARAFLALAVIFATLAIPFAFDDEWTAALWAIEAAGVYWLGVRQNSPLGRGFALLVELGAGAAFLWAGVPADGATMFANAHFIGAMLIALSGLATAYIADRADPPLPARERPLIPLLLGWGLLWWFVGGGMEIVRHFGRAEEAHAVLVWTVASVAVALIARRALAWPRLAAAGVALLPVMTLVAASDFEVARTTLTMYGWLIWPAAWAAHWCVLRAADATPSVAASTAAAPGLAGLLRFAHAASLFAVTAQLAWEASEWVARWTPEQTVWVACATALPAIVCLWFVTWCRDSSRWPFVPHADAYTVRGATPIAALLAVWFFAVNLLSPGDVAPLPYAPLFNALDLTLALAAAVLFNWARHFTRFSERTRYTWLGVGLFVTLNGIVLRVAHQWGDIPWRVSSLLASKPLQAGLTLTWSATALAVMFVATRRGLRPLWMIGAGLLAVVVAKLFLIDLGALSGLPRVVAFLGVGILLLLIGYLSPLPPAVANGKPDAPSAT